jgi:hypothetical protein
MPFVVVSVGGRGLAAVRLGVIIDDGQDLPSVQTTTIQAKPAQDPSITDILTLDAGIAAARQVRPRPPQTPTPRSSLSTSADVA